MTNSDIWEVSISSFLSSIIFALFLGIPIYFLFQPTIPSFWATIFIVAYVVTALFNVVVTVSIPNIWKKRKNDINMLKILGKEKSKGFPSLAKAYDDYFLLRDIELENSLKNKKHPAIKSAIIVKDEAKRRRQAEYSNKIIKYKLLSLFNLFPYLEEYIDIEEQEEEFQIDSNYTEEEKQDPATWYMPRKEWVKLSTAERNDLALQRYWKRRKNNVEIGRIYERYIGYLFEKQGYNVEYTGILEGFEDLGRDLVAKKKENNNEVVIIQCKYWSKYRNIHVAHINQLFGTATQYKMKNKNNNVTPMFYTTTSLDDIAKEFSIYLGIKVNELYPMDETYPCVKCNVSLRNREKIYHLPFDQQYDNTKIIEEKNELYVSTCKEAEKLGFRRAFQWHGG